MLDIQTTRTALAALGLLVGTAAVPLTAAADSGSYRLAQAGAFEDETIQAFVTARVEIEDIRATYVERIEGADSEQERLELSQQANQEMVAVIEEVPDITVEEYNAIVDAAGNDPALAERLNEEMMQPEQ